MKRTIARKMIVMSVEFRTRGSMPGAIRSEIIMRSSACCAMRHPLSEVCDSGTIGLKTRVAQGRGRGRRRNVARVGPEPPEEEVRAGREREEHERERPLEPRPAAAEDVVGDRAEQERRQRLRR